MVFDFIHFIINLKDVKFNFDTNLFPFIDFLLNSLI